MALNCGNSGHRKLRFRSCRGDRFGDTLEGCYQNVLLIDGMSVVTENCDITLTPSEWIVTDDYETYFHENFY